ncbi:MAG: BlaI/MecI/CopY family transcriptional regulator [Acidobacteriota bacterium]|nr:BlaI/MecI/CopY family transcriptional regulator [Gemmatimonadota bacterium]MDQ3175744.1 BlaI/MecI/CopY family transcriptional regulator [Acidobacteriota bacterium]
MSETRQRHLPIGYWLKRADELLAVRIDEAQQANGLSRREWQILNVLWELKSVAREELATPMRPFVDATALDDTMRTLVQRGLIEGDGSDASPYLLSKQGKETHESALSSQKEIRKRAMEGVSQTDYVTAVSVLQRLVENLEKEGSAQQGGAADAAKSRG